MQPKFVFAALLALCEASLVVERAFNICPPLTNAISKVTAQSIASKFCPSYLSISTKTVSAVITVLSVVSISTVTSTTATSFATVIPPAATATARDGNLLNGDPEQSLTRCVKVYTTTVTPTTTVYSTSLVQSNVRPAFSSIYLQARINSDVNKKFAQYTEGAGWVSFNQDGVSSATLFVLDSNCHLYIPSNNRYASTHTGISLPTALIFYGTQYITPSYAQEYAYCQVGLDADEPSGYRMICNAGGIVQSLDPSLDIWVTGRFVNEDDDGPADIEIVLPA